MRLTAIGRAFATLALVLAGLIAAGGAVLADNASDHPWAPQKDIHGTTGVQITVRRVVVNNHDGQGDVVYLCFVADTWGAGQQPVNCVRQPSTTAAR